MLYIPGSNRLYSMMLKFILKFDYFGKNSIVSPTCDIRKAAASYIYLGDNVSLGSHVWLNIPFQAPPPIKNEPIIKIGDGTAIGRRCTISGIQRIYIGEKSLFGPGVFITDHSHEFEDPSVPIKDQGVTEGCSIRIGKWCWFGHNSAVVGHRGRDIEIGEHSIVGANAVVTKSFPERSVLIGNPARNVGKLSRAKK